MKTLVEKLDDHHQSGNKLRIWWRSDDIAKVTSRFETLLKIQQNSTACISFAAIPKLMTPECLTLVLNKPRTTILQHGYSHQNYAANPSFRVELGGVRSLSEILEDVQMGYDRLIHDFDSQFFPIMVPPWHSIYGPLTYFLPEVHIRGISLKETQKIQLPLHFARLNVHIDFIEWKPQAHNKPKEKILEEIFLFLDTHSPKTPLGLLTHHDFHDESTYAVIEELVLLFSSHPACEWISVESYFENAFNV